jgi:predicted dehydrogenase
LSVGVAVIGCGYWGARYLRLFGELPENPLLWACDLVLARAQAPRASTDLAEVLDDPAVDAVVIATPASLHFAHAAAALRAGKHVLVEKPMTTSTVDAERLQAMVRDRVLMVGHTYLFNPSIRRLRDRLSEVGPVHHLEARRTHPGPVRSDVSVVWDLAAHDVAVFNFLLEASPRAVEASGNRDTAHITLDYPGGTRASLSVSWTDPERVRMLTVRAAHGELRFEETQGISRLSSGEVFDEEPLALQCRSFLGAIGGDHPISGPREGLAVVRTLEAIERAMLNGKATAV